MLLGAIFLFLVCIPLILLIFFIDKASAKPKGNIILGATVPTSNMNDEQLLKIIEEYKKKDKYFIVIALITAIPIFPIAIKSTFFATMYLLIWSFFVCIGESICIKSAFKKIQVLKKENNWTIEGRPDEDQYWNGFFYNNPNDKKFMVEKRVGIATTINFGHPIGKAFVALFAVIMIVALVPIFIMFFKLQNVDLNLNVSDNTVNIESPMYKDSFHKDEIEDVYTLTKLPESKRLNGLDDGNLLLGKFKVEGYGDSRVYIRNDVNKIVVIKLKDLTVFISGDDESEAEEIYKELLDYYEDGLVEKVLID